MSNDLTEAMKANPVAKLLAQIEQNTRSEKTAVLYKTRQELGVGKVKVKIRANVFAITDIDNVKQEFTANISVRARWKEPLFQGVSEKAEIDWDDQWNPRLELDNAVSVRNFDRKYELKYFHTDIADKVPHMCLTMNISATFKEMFELDEFPVDYQALNIWLISEWSFDQLDLVKDKEYMDHLFLNTFTESKEWYLYPQLIGEPVGEQEDIKEVTGSTEQFPLYTITAQVKRLQHFYMWNHILYMFLIFMTGLTTFSIPAAQVGSRITGAVLILVCALLYRLHMQPSLPIIAYWTALDKYNMSIMLCHILILMEHAVVGALANGGAVEHSYSIDIACLGGIMGIMLVIHCYFIAFFIQTVGKRDKFLAEETENFNDLNKAILKAWEDREKLGRWPYEAAPESNGKRVNYLQLAGQQPPPSAQARGNPLSREDSQRMSQRRTVTNVQLPPLPSPPQQVRHLSAHRHQGRDTMNPTEATLDVQITMPPEIRERSRSNSRSRSRVRGHRRNRVGSEQVETSEGE